MGGRGSGSLKSSLNVITVNMNSKEQAIFNKIPKKYRNHIAGVTVEEHSGDFNDRGQELKNYIVTWDNGDEHTFQSLSMMNYLIKENTSGNGYYVD